MAEIGNDVSKRIYEANVYEIIAQRATPDCSKEVRENWIKAKYVTKAFINVAALKDVKVISFLVTKLFYRYKHPIPLLTT